MTARPVPPCRICGRSTEWAGEKYSEFSQRSFGLGHCPSCRYSFVIDPRTDFAEIYDADYYAGRGADPHVSYADAIHKGGSVQEYEWRGIVKILEDVGALRQDSRWLDFGCGLGGLVRFGRSRGYDVTGFDEGFAADEVRRQDVPFFSTQELDDQPQSFDVITAIEVVEHVIDPMAVFARIASLLRPGGLLMLTTGNARPYRDRLPSWQYVRPDIHVSFYEPETLELCMREAGLEPSAIGYRSGFTDVIRSKVLRTVGVHHQNLLERCVPWPVMSRIVDRRYGVTCQPIARRPVSLPDA